MTTLRSIACSACGSDVPQGRLSCPACSELLASVSGAARGSSDDAVVPAPKPEADSRPMLDALLDDDPADPADPGATSVTAAAGPPLVLGLVDDEPPPPAPVAWPERPPVAPSGQPSAPPPGAYLPPSAPVAPSSSSFALGASAISAAPVGAAPAGHLAPARAWSTPSAAAPPSTTEPAETPTDDRAEERARVDEAIGWVAVGGSALALLGFLIPWARTMIGSGGTAYVDQWGLAGPGHVLIVAALGMIIAGTLVPNRIPARYRLGIPGLVVGAILIGLVWPYVLGPLGALPGAFLSLAGALTLVGAAIACLVIDRHAGGGSPV